MIAADGRLTPPAPDTKPLLTGRGEAPVTIENPPGLYGAEEGVVAHNLLKQDATFAPLVRPEITVPVTNIRYAFDESRDLKGPLVAIALALMALDTHRGVLDGRRVHPAPTQGRTRRPRPPSSWLRAVLFAAPPRAEAQDQKPGDAEAVNAISVTHLAYVLTGDASVDSDQPRGPCRPHPLPDRKDRA